MYINININVEVLFIGQLAFYLPKEDLKKLSLFIYSRPQSALEPIGFTLKFYVVAF